MKLIGLCLIRIFSRSLDFLSTDFLVQNVFIETDYLYYDSIKNDTLW